MKHMVIGGILASSMMVTAAQAEDTISAVHAFPQTLIYTQSFLKFVDKVNEAGKGVVKIEVRGGPEAIGMFQQPDAVRDGIVDMVYTPGSFYGGALPEKDALVASNLTAVEDRANGGIEMIDQIHQASSSAGTRFIMRSSTNISARRLSTFRLRKSTRHWSVVWWMRPAGPRLASSTSSGTSSSTTASNPASSRQTSV
jgi:hypothetical protein